MHTSSRSGFSTVAGAIALALLFSACRPKPPESPPAPVPPAPEVSAPASPEAAAVTAPADPAPAADAALTATTSSSASSKPSSASPAAAAREPDIATMKRAVPTSSKLGAPVDLHYQVDGLPEAGRPVTVHLAAVPRIAGNLSVSIKEAEGLQATVAPLAQQKATAGTAYRQQMSVTRAANGPAELRVLVTLETPEASAFSWFSVPLAP